MKAQFFKMMILCMITIPLSLLAEEQNKKEDAKGNIVVWRLEAKKGVSQKVVDSLSGVITSEVEKISGKKAIGETDLKAVLDSEEKKLSCGAGDTSCIVEIGASLGAPEAVSGDLALMGSYYILNLRKINIRTAQIEGRATRRIKGDIDDLIESLSSAVNELFGKKIAEKDIVKTAVPAGLDKDSKFKRPYFWYGVGMVAGGVAISLAGGLGFYSKSKSSYDEYDKMTTVEALETAKQAGVDAGEYDKEAQAHYDDGKKFSNLSIVSYAVGGAVVAGGVVMMLIKKRNTPVKNFSFYADDKRVHIGYKFEF